VAPPAPVPKRFQGEPLQDRPVAYFFKCPAYHDVRIDADALSQLPEDDNVLDDILTIDAPRPDQLKALQHLLYTRKDLILIAKTSFGKSMLLQVTPLLCTKSTALVILPLDQIGKEQSEYITKIGVFSTLPILKTRSFWRRSEAVVLLTFF
jgi:superfamily II DNA helicase RecQ